MCLEIRRPSSISRFILKLSIILNLNADSGKACLFIFTKKNNSSLYNIEDRRRPLAPQISFIMLKIVLFISSIFILKMVDHLSLLSSLQFLAISPTNPLCCVNTKLRIVVGICMRQSIGGEPKRINSTSYLCKALLYCSRLPLYCHFSFVLVIFYSLCKFFRNLWW